MGLNQRTDDRADDGQGTGERPVPRHGRAALLCLASWFEEAEPDRADALATAAYGLQPALHLEGRVDDGIAATTSWWQAAPDRSTVTEHPGTRPPEPVRDHRAQQARLRDAAESSAHWRRAGASQIRALLTEPTGDRARLDLSGAGMGVLMELLTAALGSGGASRRPTSAGDLEFALRLHVSAAPGAEVTILGEGGELTLEGLRLCVTSYDQHVLDEPAPSASDPLVAPPAPGASTASVLTDPVTSVTSAASVDPGPATSSDPDVAGAPGAPATHTLGAALSAAAPVPPADPPAPAEPVASATSAGPDETAVAHDELGPLNLDEHTAEDPAPEDPVTADRPPAANPDNETTGPIDLSGHLPRSR